MKKIVMIFAALVLAFLAVNPLPVLGGQSEDSLDLQLIDSSEHGISLELQIPWQSLRIEEEFVEGKTYLKASLPGASQSSQSGAPDLPVVLATLGIPFDVTLEVSVMPGNAHEISLSAPILPVETEETTRQLSPESQHVQEAYATQSSLIEDPVIYESAVAFPASHVVMGEDAVVRQQRIIGVQLYPLQYQPAKEN